MSAEHPTLLLDRVRNPEDLRALDDRDLPQLAAELRQETIDTVSVTGGHLGAGLGVVELTIALHKVFDTPKDKLVWDVGHQTYPHKILTERRDRIRSLRQGGGLSGFCKRDESEYDTFGAGHSSTSISAGLGMAVARDLSGKKHNVVCVIGDGAMSAGMAYEAMNNAGAMDSRLIVVLNDNDMSIAPPVGAMSAYLARLISGETYRHLRNWAKQLAKILPKAWERRAARAEEYTRGFWTGGTLFEELGFYYVGPIDGHNFDHLLPVLRNVRDTENGPILIHVVTQKGKGYEPAEISADKFHGVNRFNVVTGAQEPSSGGAPSYTKVFANALIEEAKADGKIVAITAAMPSGTGLDRFAEAFPDRSFDVGIAEQHAVTFAAGLAAEGYKPFAAIYSTFLQRAYDQVVHDVAVQGLPVRFAIDRAGLVGADGPTHAGAFDVTYLSCLPGFVVMAATTRQSSCTWWRPPPPSTIGRRLSAIRAAKAPALPCRNADRSCLSARDASCARARPWRSCPSEQGLPKHCGRAISSRASASPPPSPTRVSPSRSTRTWCGSSRGTMRFSLPSRKERPEGLHRRSCTFSRATDCSIRGSRYGRSRCLTTSSSMTSHKPCMRGPGSMPPAS